MTTVNAKGLSCPEPVILLRKAMSSKENEYSVIVDNAVSMENCTRYAEHEGYRAETEQQDGIYTLHLTKT